VTLGREAERAELASFVDGLSTGPSALLLEGEPGIGKSTLWSDGVDLARARGAVVLSCRPSGSDAELSFVGLGDLLRTIPDEAIGELPDPQREALEVALLRRPRGSRRLDARAVSVATFGVMRAVSRATPLVMAVDDAHLLDPPTARVLSFVVRRLSDQPLGLLLARSALDGAPPLGVADALPPDRLRRMLVGPLEVGELAALVRERIGLAMAPSEASRLREVSGGNPFYALEIARAAARGDEGVTGQSLPIPKNLRDDVVRQRLGALPQSCADLLLVAAAAGRPTPELLRAFAGESETGTIQPAIDAGLISVSGASIRFSHPLYRSAIYANASRARRHAVHRRLAELTSDPEERARHLALSADTTDPEVAHALEGAAQVARDRGAPDAAAELLEHAIRLTPADDASAACRRHLEASHDRFIGGDTEAAADHAREALRGSGSATDRAESLRRLAAIDVERGATAAARRALERAASEAGEDTLVSVEVHRDLAALLLRTGDLRLAERHAAAALERAERSGSDAPLAAARTILARVALLRGETSAVLRSTPAVARSAGDGMELVLAEAEIVAGEHERARRRLGELQRSATERGDELGRRSALVRLAELELRDGAWELATSLAQDARTLAGDLGLGDAQELGLLAALAAVRGLEDETRAYARQGLGAADEDRLALLWSLGALGLLELSLGQPELAIRHLGRAGGIATDMGLADPAVVPFLADEPEALVGAGELELARPRIDWLQERGEALGRGSAIGAAARGRGLLLAETGDLSGALESFARSVEAFENLPLPFETARSWLALGGCRRRDRQKRPAREALEHAREGFEALGATIWAARTRAELARISGRRASFHQLTESEARVVRLAASGRTNREIARSLSMSVRTVEGHLSHAYAKLGLRSRTELAVFVDRAD